MSAIHIRPVTKAHDYTRSKTPWILTEHRSSYGKLIHYLSGGGMRAFGRTVRQEEAHRKHVRFFLVSGFLSILWLILYVT